MRTETTDLRQWPLGEHVRLYAEHAAIFASRVTSWTFYDQHGRCIAVVRTDLAPVDANGAPL
jgi:hypothetical protein